MKYPVFFKKNTCWTPWEFNNFTTHNY